MRIKRERNQFLCFYLNKPFNLVIFDDVGAVTDWVDLLEDYYNITKKFNPPFNILNYMVKIPVWGSYIGPKGTLTIPVRVI